VATGFNAQTGKVFVEYQRCIGCGVCVTKCPQDVRKMVDEERVLFCKPLPKNLVREPNLKRQTKKK
jgi:Fe-S-cluster-containing dehydrogenase component